MHLKRGKISAHIWQHLVLVDRNLQGIFLKSRILCENWSQIPHPRAPRVLSYKPDFWMSINNTKMRHVLGLLAVEYQRGTQTKLPLQDNSWPVLVISRVCPPSSSCSESSWYQTIIKRRIWAVKKYTSHSRPWPSVLLSKPWLRMTRFQYGWFPAGSLTWGT